MMAGTVVFNTDQANLTGGSLDPGSTLYFTVTTTAASAQDVGNSWNIQASDDPDRANAVACYGSQELDIVQQPPTISNIQLSSLTTSTVTVSWDTDSATEGNIDYGPTSDYGSSPAS